MKVGQLLSDCRNMLRFCSFFPLERKILNGLMTLNGLQFLYLTLNQKDLMEHNDLFRDLNRLRVLQLFLQLDNYVYKKDPQFQDAVWPKFVRRIFNIPSLETLHLNIQRNLMSRDWPLVKILFTSANNCSLENLVLELQLRGCKDLYQAPESIHFLKEVDYLMMRLTGQDFAKIFSEDMYQSRRVLILQFIQVVLLDSAQIISKCTSLKNLWLYNGTEFRFFLEDFQLAKSCKHLTITTNRSSKLETERLSSSLAKALRNLDSLESLTDNASYIDQFVLGNLLADKIPCLNQVSKYSINTVYDGERRDELSQKTYSWTKATIIGPLFELFLLTSSLRSLKLKIVIDVNIMELLKKTLSMIPKLTNLELILFWSGKYADNEIILPLEKLVQLKNLLLIMPVNFPQKSFQKLAQGLLHLKDLETLKVSYLQTTTISEENLEILALNLLNLPKLVHFDFSNNYQIKEKMNLLRTKRLNS